MAENEFVPPKVNIWIIALSVALATFMEVLDTSIASVALPHISGGLGASVDEGNWVLTSYLVANAVILPVGSWASSVLGRKNFFLICIAIFTVSSFLCGIAPTLPLLLFFRVLQGAGGGGLVPLSQAILFDTFPPAKHGQAFAFFGIVAVLAPSVGPTLGGWITDSFSWRWIFFINIPVGIAALILNYRLLEDPPTSRGDRRNLARIDTIGFGLLALGMGALQVTLDKGEEKGWFDSNYIVAFAITAAVSLLALFVWEWRHPDPLIKVKLIRHRNFAASCVLMFLLGCVLNSGVNLLPLLQQSLFGYTATLAGLSVTAAGVSMIFLFALAGNLTKVFQVRYLAAFGFITMAAGYYITAMRIVPQASFETFEWLRIYQVFGLAFLFTSITTGAYLGLPAGESNQISGITNLMRNIGGSASISICNAVVTERAQFHQSRLGGHLTASNGALRGDMMGRVQHFIHSGFNQVRAVRMAFGSVGRQLAGQTHTQAYADVYLGLAGVCIVGIAGVFFLIGNKPGEGEVHGH